MGTKIISVIKKYRAESFLAIFAFLSVYTVAIWSLKNNMVTILDDQYAHITLARLLIDSITPGISQLGMWPPLLHVIIAPFTAIPGLYTSGFAGFFAIIPFYILSVVLLYKVLIAILASKKIALFGTALYMLNPFVMYYAATPMMEILFLSFVIATAYLYIRWTETSNISFLIFTGVTISLATLARFEGLLLFPLLTVLVFLELYRRKYGYHKLEATLIIFWFTAIVGIGYYMLYHFVYFGNPLAFIGIGDTPLWNLENPTGERVKTAHPLTIFLHASYYMMSLPIVWLGIISSIAAYYISDNKRVFLSTLLIFFTPAAVVLINMFRGASSVYVPEFSPSNDFHNVRYALTWLPFIVLSLSGFVAYTKKRLPESTSTRITYIFMAVCLSLSALHIYDVAVQSQYQTIKQDRSATKNYTEDIPVGAYIRDTYDGGFIFINRFGNDEILLESELPLRTFVHEGNNLYYQEVLNEPWLYARLVFMESPEVLDINGRRSDITDYWWENNEFKLFYEEVFEHNNTKVFKIREDVLKLYASEQNIPLQLVPSISKNNTIWEVNQIEDYITNIED